MTDYEFDNVPVCQSYTRHPVQGDTTRKKKEKIKKKKRANVLESGVQN